MRRPTASLTGVADVVRRLAAGPRRIARSAELVADQGRGSYLHTTDGSRLLDAVSGYGVASLGHSHPHWVDAVVAQARRLAVSPLYTSELARYLEALANLLPPRLGQIALFSGGAEAVEAAVRVGQTVTGHRGVLTFAASFHGKTAAVRYAGDPTSGEAHFLGPEWLRTLPFPSCDRHDALAYAACEETAGALLEALALEPGIDAIGTVLVEPVLGTAGNVPPKRRFLSELRQFCDRQGALLIFDESITGFGRTGELFASGYFGVEPDVLVLGKGLGGGFPLSAVCAATELWSASALAGPSATSTSYGGNPLACAAGLATLEVLAESDFLAQVREVSVHAALRLRELAAASGQVAQPRGVGLMLGFDLVDPETGALASPESCNATFRACLDRGLLVAADVPRVRLSPPLTLSIPEADELFDALFAVLA